MIIYLPLNLKINDVFQRIELRMSPFFFAEKQRGKQINQTTTTTNINLQQTKQNNKPKQTRKLPVKPQTLLGIIWHKTGHYSEYREAAARTSSNSLSFFGNGLGKQEWHVSWNVLKTKSPKEMGGKGTVAWQPQGRWRISLNRAWQKRKCKLWAKKLFLLFVSAGFKEIV